MNLDRKYINRIDQMVDRLRRIEWFQNCGHPIDDTFLNIIYITSWEEAIRSYNSTIWENMQLEARGALTSFLHNKNKDKYDLWNIIVKEAKKYVEGELSQKIEGFRQKYDLDAGFINSVKWDTLAAIMEYVYLEYKIPIFYLNLLSIYEQGNFPCGWQGDWPNGNFVVF